MKGGGEQGDEFAPDVTGLEEYETESSSLKKRSWISDEPRSRNPSDLIEIKNGPVQRPKMPTPRGNSTLWILCMSKTKTIQSTKILLTLLVTLAVLLTLAQNTRLGNGQEQYVTHIGIQLNQRYYETDDTPSTKGKDSDLAIVPPEHVLQSDHVEEIEDKTDGPFRFGTLPDNEKVEAVVLVGLGPKTVSSVGAYFRALKALKIDIQSSEVPESIIPMEFISRVINETRRIDYTLATLSPIVREVVQLKVDEIVNLLRSRRVSDRSSIPGLVLPHAVFLLPFFADSSSRLGINVFPVLSTSFALDSVFDSLETILGAVGPSLIHENVIDKLCLMRIRPWALESRLKLGFDRFNNSFWPSLSWISHIQLKESIAQNVENGRQCMILDITPLRAVQLWSMVYGVVSSQNYLEENNIRGFIFKTESIASEPKGSHVRLLEMISGLDSGLVHGEISAFLKRRTTVRQISDSVPTWAQSDIADKALLCQLALSVSHRVLHGLGYPHMHPRRDFLSHATHFFGKYRLSSFDSSQPETLSELEVWAPINNAPQQTKGEFIDAGHCVQTKSKKATPEEKKHLTRSFGNCLPSFTILGAQKAGTDELAVWLNMNKYSRRLDGGVEIHFFDCLERGQGWDRQPCERIRRSAMTFNSHAAKTDTEREYGPKKFIWKELRASSPYITSWWKQYQKLGNLGYNSFFTRQSLTFEKTPAYMDLADPNDVVRFLPSLKLVFMFRDPVDRFISSYFQLCSGMYHQFYNCSYTDLEQRFVRISSGMESDSVNFDDHMDSIVYRNILHSYYIIWLEKWRRSFPDNQIMIVFSKHFKMYPQATIYAIETFNGLNTTKQHHEYHPHMTASGFYALGEYSKARKPSHNAKPPKELREKLEHFFSPWSRRLREALLSSSITYRPQSAIPERYKNEHYSNFDFPSWLENS